MPWCFATWLGSHPAQWPSQIFMCCAVTKLGWTVMVHLLTFNYFFRSSSSFIQNLPLDQDLMVLIACDHVPCRANFLIDGHVTWLTRAVSCCAVMYSIMAWLLYIHTSLSSYASWFIVSQLLHFSYKFVNVILLFCLILQC